ncbi:MAG: PEP-CTERM sorting domain-containing protein [Motiliproteus sp.]|nr:PEP-CTERM sorting domain-containing protein [Motiliproteus sp.]MCW9053301.1 PEP-CTERM sorting domain-containing protein [Motiliproteus sp.]
MKNFAKATLAASVLAISAGASASDMYIDLGDNSYDILSGFGIGTGDADGKTGIFNEFGFSQLRATSVYDFNDSDVGGSFYDTNIPSELAALGIPTSGTALDGLTTVNLTTPTAAQVDIDALSPLAPPTLGTDNEGFINVWGLDVLYHFDGTLTAGGPVYTGGTFEVFFSNPGALGSIADGTKVLGGTLTSSTLNVANLDLFFDLDFALDGFLFIEQGGAFIDAEDVISGGGDLPRLILDTNVAPPIPTADQLLVVDATDNIIGNGNDDLQAVRQANLDGSITAEIPEPGTLALLGLGLFGLGAATRRKA